MTSKKHSIKGASDFVTAAYKLEDEASMQSFYANWASDYDQQMIGNLKYVAPDVLAQYLIQHIADTNARVLDIGCGTGLAVRSMHKAGYRDLHGMDLSAEMLAVANSRGFYAQTYCMNACDPFPMQDESFDAVICSGTFTHGHVGSKPLAEIARVLKPSGLLACAVHQDLWQAKGFEQAFESLEADGILQCVSRDRAVYFEGSEPEGWYCYYKKCKL